MTFIVLICSSLFRIEVILGKGWTMPSVCFSFNFDYKCFLYIKIQIHRCGNFFSLYLFLTVCMIFLTTKMLRVLCMYVCMYLFVFSPFLLGYIYCSEGIHCDRQFQIGLYCTLVRSLPPSLTLNPLPTPLKAIAREFIVLFHTSTWYPSTIFTFPYLHFLHIPFPFPQVLPHTVPILYSCFSLLTPMSMFNGVSWSIPAMSLLYFGLSLLFCIWFHEGHLHIENIKALTNINVISYYSVYLKFNLM
jgi:hypothetical protein